MNRLKNASLVANAKKDWCGIQQLISVLLPKHVLVIMVDVVTEKVIPCNKTATLGRNLHFSRLNQ